MPGTGKRCLLQSIAGDRGYAVVAHNVRYGEPTLSLLRTLALWGQAWQTAALGPLADTILQALANHRVQTAFVHAVQIIERLIDAGHRIAFVITHAHFLDRTSVAFVKEVPPAVSELL